MATSLWVAVVGILGTLTGVIFTQIWTSRLDERRWERERQRELEAREDANRTYEHRRAAYADFLREFERLRRLYVDGDAANRPAISQRTFDELSAFWTAITLYGTDRANDLANDCLASIKRWVADPDNDDAAESALEAWFFFLEQIREDLDVPGHQPVRSAREDT